MGRKWTEEEKQKMRETMLARNQAKRAETVDPEWNSSMTQRRVGWGNDSRSNDRYLVNVLTGQRVCKIAPDSDGTNEFEAMYS